MKRVLSVVLGMLIILVLSVQASALNTNNIDEEGGVDKLRDNRGRTKPVEEMTEIEKLKAEMKILEAKNRQLEIHFYNTRRFQKRLNCMTPCE